MAGRRHRNCLRRYRVPLVWLAVLAVVTQSVLFELAMAARAQAAASGPTHRHAHHGEIPAKKPSAPGHKHQEDCPFCLARAANPPLPALPGLGLPSPAAGGRIRQPISIGRVRARRRPTRFRARSPPLHSDR
jgi:hypothetical protein